MMNEGLDHARELEQQAAKALLDEANERARRHQLANEKLLKAFADIEDQRAASGAG